MKRFLLSAVILAFVFAVSGCLKGEQGPPGQDGQDGNANVRSQTITITPDKWYHVGTAGEPDEGYETVQNVSVITQDIVNDGAVLMYLSNNGSQWFALPFTFPSGVSSTYPYSESWNFSYLLGQVVIDVQDTDFQTVAPQSSVMIKVVAIASLNFKKNADVDWSDYKAVQDRFNLAD